MTLHQGFFNQSIFEFYVNDVNSCLQASKLKQGGSKDFPGGLNFTVALVIFCVIEMLAGFYKGEINPSNDDVTDFISKYFSAYDSIFKNKDFSKNFYKVFRHGLVHGWSPKASGVAMDFNNQKIVGKLKAENEDIMFINIPPFYDLTVKAFYDYQKDLDRGNYVEEFERRYNNVIKADYNEMKTLREKFDLLIH